MRVALVLLFVALAAAIPSKRVSMPLVPGNVDVKLPSKVGDDFPFNGAAWQQKTASDKQSELSSYVIKDKTAADWYGALTEAQLLVEPLNTTFDYPADDFPKQFLGLETRKKLIHTVGPIARCKFVSSGTHNFTGLFKGANYGFVRFSTAQAPDASAKYGFAPGIGVKFLRDGVPSANVMAMFSLEGTESFNFFKHDLTNHVPNLGPHAPFSLKLIKSKFLGSSIWANMVGISDWAKYGDNGQEESSPQFPFRLVFHPTKTVHSLYPDQTDKSLGDQLSTLPAGVIYHVYGYTSVDSKPQLMGDLVTLESPSSSYFGDRSLFFQHQRMEDDMQYHPEWVGPAQKLTDEQGAVDHWTFPDLPFDN